jgi:hypothetical protein
VEATKQKEEKRGKPKPEEQAGMPQRQHCPPHIKNNGYMYMYLHASKFEYSIAGGMAFAIYVGETLILKMYVNAYMFAAVAARSGVAQPHQPHGTPWRSTASSTTP